MAIDIKSVLSEEEIKMIDRYRELYARPGLDEDERQFERISEPMAPTVDVLQIWAQQKENIFHMFGDKLVVEKEYFYDKPISEIEDNLRECLGEEININDIRNAELIPEAANFWRKFRSTVVGKESNWRIENGLCYYYSLAKNRWDYEGVTVADCGIKIQKGAKIIKLIEKFARAYDILDGFESFRLVHSQILNSKKVRGTLCFSIHPLDYMTMSDNGGCWQSCMSWTEDGCYRQGTVEMMNSDCTIVAYIKKSEDWEFDWRNSYSWNTKKWRQLFVINPDIISGIKPYPYYDDNITNYCLETLVDLAGRQNYYKKPVRITYNSHMGPLTLTNDDDTTFDIDGVLFYFKTGLMYNDISHSVDDGMCYVGKTVVQNYQNIDVLYSGVSQCMWCGDTDYLECDSLCCSDCYYDNEPEYTCDYCGYEMYSENEVYYLDDTPLCYSCYHDRAVEAVNDNEMHNRDHCLSIKVLENDGETCHNLLSKNTEETAYFYWWGYRSRRDDLSKFGEIGIFHWDNYSPNLNVAMDNIIYIKRDNPYLQEFMEAFELFEDDFEMELPYGNGHLKLDFVKVENL